jgi:hypothetical protein
MTNIEHAKTPIPSNRQTIVQPSVAGPRCSKNRQAVAAAKLEHVGPTSPRNIAIGLHPVTGAAKSRSVVM